MRHTLLTENGIITESVANWLPLQKGILLNYIGFKNMLKRLKELYKEYKPYVRVDLIMYAALILMIFLYFIISLLVE